MSDGDPHTILDGVSRFGDRIFVVVEFESVLSGYVNADGNPLKLRR